MISSKPLEQWTAPMLLLLKRLVETSVAADRASAELRKIADLADDRALKLTKSICALNTSVTGLLTRLRLTPQAVHSRRETGYNNEVGSDVLNDRLIGGYAVHGPRQ
jgi:hypothetical protein